MTRGQQVIAILGLIVAVCACVAAWLTVPQIQRLVSQPVKTGEPTLSVIGMPTMTAGTPPVLPVKVEVAKVRASSSYYRVRGDEIKYGPENAIDGKVDTVWVAASGDFAGDWIEFVFSTPKTVMGLKITASNIREANLIFSDNSNYSCNFKEVVGWQYYEISPVATNSIRMVVRSTFANTTAYICEIEFYGR